MSNSDDNVPVDEDVPVTSVNPVDATDHSLKYGPSYAHIPLNYDNAKMASWVIVKYEGEFFLGIIIEKYDEVRLAKVRCLEKPFAINEPTKMEPECCSSF